MAEDSTSPPENLHSPLRLIEPHVPELRVAILSHVPDRQTLRNAILSCSIFSTVYHSHQRQILLQLAQHAFEIDNVNIAIPLLACRAQQLDVLAPNHLETVTALLKTNPEHYTMTKQATVQISIDECKRMLCLNDVASQICNDLVSEIPLHHPLGKVNVIGQESLSASERCRISTAVYRWELWTGLFSQRACGLIQTQDSAAQIDIDDQRVGYLGRYTPWEQEQLGCLYDYVHRQYRQLFDESGNWYNQNKGPGPFDPAKEDLSPWFMLCEDVYTRELSLDRIISRGPQLLAALLRKNDAQWRCDTIMACIYNFDPCFREIICAEDLVKIPVATDEDIGATTKDQPYGYRWALASPIKPGEPSVWKAPGFLWHWGYAFWDEGRLRNWGFEIGGPFFYTEVSSMYSDEKDGIRDRVSGRLLQEPQLE